MTDMVDINYQLKLNDIKNLLLQWSKRIIPTIGKHVVINTIAVSRIYHLLLSQPNPNINININFLQHNCILNFIKRAPNILGIGQSDNKLINPIMPLTIKLISCIT